MFIAVDFDGTCVTHEYPRIGQDIGAVPVLKELVAKGHQIILWTVRSGDLLEDAVQWFRDRGIELYAVNENPNQSVFSVSPKAYANLYIDDSSLGAPLTTKELGGRPYIDWETVRKWFYYDRIL